MLPLQKQDHQSPGLPRRYIYYACTRVWKKAEYEFVQSLFQEMDVSYVVVDGLVSILKLGGNLSIILKSEMFRTAPCRGICKGNSME